MAGSPFASRSERRGVKVMPAVSPFPELVPGSVPGTGTQQEEGRAGSPRRRAMRRASDLGI